MGFEKIVYLLKQKFIPNAKKDIVAEIRLKNGYKLFRSLPNHVKSFKLKKDALPYYITGKPDIDDFTGQRVYTFVEGVSYPIIFDEAHEGLVATARNFGNSEDELILADDNGYRRGLLMNKTGFDFAKFTFVIALIHLVTSGIAFYLIMKNLGIIGGS